MSQRNLILKLCLCAVSICASVAQAAPPAELPDRVVVFKSREDDLLKPEFSVGLKETAEQLMSEPQRFWSLSDQRKTITRLQKIKEEADVRIEVRHVMIENYKLKKIEGSIRVINQLGEKTSGPLNSRDEVVKALEKIPVGPQARVVLVVLFFERVKK